ncbi:MAG: rRNA maturation RNase YbeY [Minisyncoccota bacterium]
MDVRLEYTEEVKTPFSKNFFQDIAVRTLQACHFPFLQNKEISLTAVSVSIEKIRMLNEKYRQKDAITDILSFGEYTDLQVLMQDSAEDIFLGELFFCASFIADSAKEDGVTWEREMKYVFSHGVLHLVGFDHEEEMFTIQDMVTDTV